MIPETYVLRFARRYSDEAGKASYLGGFHNDVYLIEGRGEFILRISPATRRTLGDTSAEIDFLQYLHSGGASVSYPLQCLNGESAYEAAHGGHSLVVSAFSRAGGLDWRTRGIDEAQRFVRIGQAIGRIHRLSKEYRPAKGLIRRQWHENPHLTEAEAIFGRHSRRLADNYLNYIGIMKRLPRDADGFGLIHGDYLFSNYHIDGNEVVVFDFDECEYSWYACDIAVCMYYYLLGGDPSELSGKSAEAEEMFYFLLSGYFRENELNADWIGNIGFFFQMREFILLSTILKDLQGQAEGWQKAFVEGALDRQLNGKPFIEADFMKVWKSVIS